MKQKIAHFSGLGQPVTRLEGTNPRLDGVVMARPTVAKGWGTFIDAAFIGDLVRLANETPYGVKVRFGHPNMCGDPIGTELGRAVNWREEDGSAVADVVFTPTAMNQKEIAHILTLAGSPEANTMIANSIEYIGGIVAGENDEPVQDLDGNSLEYITKVVGTAFVSDGALTDGLFEKSQAASLQRAVMLGLTTHREALRAYLSSNPLHVEQIRALLPESAQDAPQAKTPTPKKAHLQRRADGVLVRVARLIPLNPQPQL
jgi:hypothetical protein